MTVEVESPSVRTPGPSYLSETVQAGVFVYDALAQRRDFNITPVRMVPPRRDGVVAATITELFAVILIAGALAAPTFAFRHPPRSRFNRRIAQDRWPQPRAGLRPHQEPLRSDDGRSPR